MSLPAYTQQPCVPCTKNELDLESVLPLQINIINDYLVHTGPKSGLESGGLLQFLIPTSSDDNLDLSHCYLYLKCWVLNSDGSYIETLKTDASKGVDASREPTVPLPLQTIQLDLVMNFALVAMSGDTYPSRAYLMTLLSYGCDVKETWLRHLEGLQMDEDGKYDDAQENNGLISCWGMIAGCTRTCCCKSDWCQTT